MLRAVCFDLMDTVIVDPYREALAAGTGLPAGELSGLVDRRAWPDFEEARIDEATFAARFFLESSGRTLDLAALHRARRAGYRWVPGMRELVGGLGGRVDRHVASNYPVWIEELRREFALDERFEGVWASHHLGVRKPAPVFFTRLLAAVGHAPGACLLVDDRVANCAAAEAAGMRAHRFTTAADLAVRLRAEGVATAVPGEVSPGRDDPGGSRGR